MPYINEELRKIWDPAIENLIGMIDDNTPVGILNYTITRILIKALGNHANYTRHNGIIGVLSCAQMELYRRATAILEDIKAKENGDVYFDINNSQGK